MIVRLSKSLTVLLLCFNAIAEPLEKCHQNPCHNSGMCYKVNSNLRSSGCPKGFGGFNGHCYKFVHKRVNWFQARDICSATAGSSTVFVESEKERQFIKRLILYNLAPNDGSPLKSSHNVWTVGRFDYANGNPRRSHWFQWELAPPRKASPSYLAPGQPARFNLTDDSCLSIIKPYYTNWAVQSCDSTLNYYICKMKDPGPKGLNDEHGYYSYQCRCPEGYAGLQCDQQLGQFEDFGRLKLHCADEPFTFTCSPSKTIEVEFALYGRPMSVGRCPGPKYQENCASLSSLTVLRQQCQGRSVCKINDLGSLFKDYSCLPGTTNILEYRFRCVVPSQNTCPEKTTLYGGRCYETVELARNQRKGWHEARKYCQVKGGDLAGPLNREQQKWLKQRLEREHADSILHFWIGLKRRRHEKDWRWTTGGVKLNDRPRGAKLQPSHPFYGPCIAYFVVPSDNSFGKPHQNVNWIAKRCDQKFNFICEYPSNGQHFQPGLMDPNWRSDTEHIDGKTAILPVPTLPLPTQASDSKSKVGASVKISNNESVTTTPIIINKVVRLCAKTTYKGLAFGVTVEGDIATAECPNQQKGAVKWKCSGVAAVPRYFPDKPDFMDCHDPWAAELENKLNNGDEALKIAKQLKTEVSTKQELDGGTLQRSVSIMDQLVEIEKNQLMESEDLSDDQKIDQAVEFTKTIGETSDMMIGNTLISSWDNLPGDARAMEATKLLNNLEQSASLLSFFLNDDDSRSFEFDNLQINVQVKSLVQARVAKPRPLLPVHGSATDRPVISESDSLPDYGQTVPADGSSSSDDGDIPSHTEIPEGAIWPPPQPTLDGIDSKGVAKDQATIQLPHIGLLSSLGGTQKPTNPFSSPFNHGEIQRPGMALPRVRLGYYLYKNNVAKLLEPSSEVTWKANISNQTIVNSQVIGATINRPGRSLKLPPTSPVRLTFYHIRIDDVTNPRCVFWNTTFNGWDETGCWVKKTTLSLTDCECNHLTSFAVLMDLTGNIDSDIPIVHEEILTWLTRIGCIISVACLALSIAAFSAFRSIWGPRNTVHRNLCLCLLIGELLFLFGIDETESRIACAVTAGLLHYFFLAAFIWMLLEGYQLYLMLVKVFQSESDGTVYYYLIGYGVPTIIVSIALGVNWEDYGTERYCWINAKTPTIWAFIVPVILVIVVNIVILLLALKIVFSVSSLQDRSKVIRLRGWLKGSAVLLCLLGITWIFGFFLLIGPAAVVFAYIFTILNALQGLYIFTFHVLMNDKLYAPFVRRLKRICPCCVPDKYHSGTASSNSNNLRKGSQSGSTTNSGATVSSGVPLWGSTSEKLLVSKAAKYDGLSSIPKSGTFLNNSDASDNSLRWRGCEASDLPEEDSIAAPNLLWHINCARSISYYEVPGISLYRNQPHGQFPSSAIRPIPSGYHTEHLCSKDCKDAKYQYDPRNITCKETNLRKVESPIDDCRSECESFVTHF